jgi:hypothetical protein
MVQTAQARNRNHGCVRCWLLLDGPSVRRVLFQTIVKAVLVMAVHVIADQPTEMFFIQRDDMVKELAPATSHPALCNAILPRLWVVQTGFTVPRCQSDPDSASKRDALLLPGQAILPMYDPTATFETALAATKTMCKKNRR